jgi:lipopolysaccharide biosynthesis protein
MRRSPSSKILPFLHVADRLFDEGVDVVLKLHTKHSTHRDDGERSRKELIDTLLSPEHAQRTYQAFREDRALGLSAVEDRSLPTETYKGADKDSVEYLIARLGLPDASVHAARFTDGSMCWVRLAALRPLLDAHLGIWEFEDNTGQIDGTLARAVERMLTAVANAAGYTSRDIASLCSVPGSTPAQPQSYARRSV